MSLAELADRPLSSSLSASDSQPQLDLSLVDILARILENVTFEGDLLCLSNQNSHDDLDLRTPKIPKKDRAIVRDL